MGEQTETELVEGAGLRYSLISELSGVKDGSLKPGNGSYYTPEDFITYDYSKDETASYWENGKKITVPELFTDKKKIFKVQNFLMEPMWCLSLQFRKI